MKTRLASLLLLAAGSVLAAPSISSRGIYNAASYIPFGAPNAGVAQGGMFVIFGSEMGPSTLQIINAFPLPTTFGGTSVRFTVGGTNVDALMIYTSAGQLAAILPSRTPLGDAEVRVTFNGQTSPPETVRVVRNSFGIFTRNQGGSGPAIAQNFRSATDQPVNSLTEVARPGQVIVLWGTGLGPVTGDEAGGALPGDLSLDIEVFIGGKSATITYKGRSGCCAGIDQIAFVVPDGVQGCYVPLVVRAGGVVSNFVSMAIAASGNTCSDPLSFSPEDLQRLQTSGSFRSGSVNLSRSSSKFTFQGSTIDSRTDSGSGAFVRWDPVTLLANVGQTPTFGSCTLQTYRGTPNIPTFQFLDAGPVLNLAGPKGTKQLTKQFGVYSATLGGGTPIPVPGAPAPLPDYLDPGEYTADNGSGGADVGAFRARVTLPVALVWSNQDSITTVARGQDLRINWTGGDSRDFVIMSGSSSTGTDPRNLTSSSFTCIERVSAGGFTIPSYVLGSLPASDQGFLSVGSFSNYENNRFTAPGLDQANFSYNFNSSKSVRYQ